MNVVNMNDGEIHALSKEYAVISYVFDEPVDWLNEKLSEKIDSFIKKYVDYICKFNQELLCEHLYSCLMKSIVQMHNHSFHDYVQIKFRPSFEVESITGRTGALTKPTLCLKFKRAKQDNLIEPV